MNEFNENLKKLIFVYEQDIKNGNINKIYEDATAQYQPDSNKVNWQKVMNQALFKCGYTAEDTIVKCGRTYRYMFAECDCLEKIKISSISNINLGAFYRCINLQEVKIEEGIKNIGVLAFNNCTNLKNIYLPSTINEIGQNAFKGCPLLKEINYNGTTKEFENFWNNNNAFTFEIFDNKGIKIICNDSELKI